jgi:uncharacterized protein
MLRRAGVVVVILIVAWLAWGQWRIAGVETDVLVVGAGIGGLSAAYEAGQGGLRVAVAEMNSVFGGNGVISEGGMFIVDTPLQRSQGLADSPEIAESDILSWGEDADPDWARILARDSRREVYDWLSALGVEFFAVRPQAGNHVPRFHENREKGLGVVRAIYRECTRNPEIDFHWNMRIVRLTVEAGRVTGAEGTNMRSGARVKFRAPAVVLATGGFQGNERLVREHWPSHLPRPERLLIGASPNSSGAGLAMGMAAGAAVHRLNHQWHYPFGVPDPRFPNENRAVSVRNLNAIWVNTQGRRFVNEWKGSRYTVEAVVRQEPATYWMVFDQQGVADLRYSGTDWSDLEHARKLLVENPAVTVQGETWAELAQRAGLPQEELVATLERYNRMVRAGQDEDFQRFGTQALPGWLQVFPVPEPRELRTPPFYAMQAFPMTRKSMGGLRIDTDCRVLDKNGRAIAGLYAVGEVAGLGGVNGRAGLEGTFLAPSLIQGRRAGRSIAGGARRQTRSRPSALERIQGEGGDALCRLCHGLPMRYYAGEHGYRHFGRAHHLAEERGFTCVRCHAEIEIARPWRHRIDNERQTAGCGECHLPRSGPVQGAAIH